MSIFDDLINEAKNKNLSAAQVPVTQVTTTPAVTTVKKDDLVQLVKQQAEMIAALNAKLTQVSATQVSTPAPVITAPVRMTRISSYPAGVKNGRKYDAGFKWHAKQHAEGAFVYGGVSIDTLYQIRAEFPRGKEKDFFNEIDAVLSNDEIMKTTHAYKKIVAEKGKIAI